MKILSFYFTILFIFSVTTLFAQQTALPTDSAMFVYEVNTDPNIAPYNTNLTVKIKGDTLLGGVKYSKIYYAWGHDTAYNSPNNKLHCFIRNDTSLRAYVRYPAYYNGDTSDILLYDFKQEIGDTFDLPVFTSKNALGQFCNYTCKYKVTSKINIWSSFLNRDIIIIQYTSAQMMCNNLYSMMTEFKGSADLLLYNELYCLYGGSNDSVLLSSARCFWYKGRWGTLHCSLIPSTIENRENDLFVTIYPNPFSNKTNIEFSPDKFEYFQMTDLMGTIVCQLPIKENQDKISLERNSLASGIYIGRFIGSKNQTQCVKIVIN